jgi:hypothetical protein
MVAHRRAELALVDKGKLYLPRKNGQFFIKSQEAKLTKNAKFSLNRVAKRDFKVNCIYYFHVAEMRILLRVEMAKLDGAAKARGQKRKLVKSLTEKGK